MRWVNGALEGKRGKGSASYASLLALPGYRVVRLNNRISGKVVLLVFAWKGGEKGKGQRLRIVDGPSTPSIFPF